jgi:hypothetical protein
LRGKLDIRKSLWMRRSVDRIQDGFCRRQTVASKEVEAASRAKMQSQGSLAPEQSDGVIV